MASEEKNHSILGQLKEKLHRMLGNKETESFDISFNAKQSSASARKAYRIHVDNMQVVCRTPRVKCRIKDISVNGIGFISSEEFPIGVIIDTVLIWSGKPILKNLKLKIVRRKEELVGCEFHELNKDQDKIISKIVVAAQKRTIKKTKSCKNTNDTTEDEITKIAEKQDKHNLKKQPTKKIEL
ncbi:PilZ domain-containing protein [Desulfovibrio sp. UCD-KL4C]|uniref:PilZ domain-containing protein n=1 Tax=Desulfovibrio sp. UCD-KL4C TaxID=2578120 RepID=UPI0025BF43CA|nr:PilZ domain-containing protein [Desulfovibrio sp. UCD-KL4C]